MAETDDPNVRKLHGRIVQLRKDREWEARYMLFEELLREREQQGREEGIHQILGLTRAMEEAGEADQIPRLSREPEFLAEMLKKYHL